ncbi:Na(+), Li(+), K(+)/H(+) antiporter subunit A/B [Oxalobacteraceae bacterium]
MAKNIRFGDYVQAVTVDSDSISYSKLIPKPKLDKNGNEIPMKPEKLKLAGTDIYNLLQPYLSVRIMEQIAAVFPLAAYLVLFQILVLQRSIMGAAEITAGLVAVIIGLMIFMEGLKLGLMPFGDIIGNTLPKKLPLVGVLFIAGLLGIGVTYAEPAIGTLKLAGALVDPEKAPALFYLLMVRTDVTVLLVGFGVGVAAIIGTMRFLYGWSLKPLIYWSLLPGVILTAYCALDSNLASIVGLAWDCGGVTTGPVTVPLVLALGIGVANSGGKGDSSLSGFGIVTLASIYPVVAVLGLGVYFGGTVSLDEMKAANAVVYEALKATGGDNSSVWDQILMGPIKDGVQAIVPLVIFLMIILFGVLRTRLPNAFIICYGLVLSVVGMCLFNIGLKYGLSALGEQAGNIIPGSFTNITLPESLRVSGETGAYGPLYGSFWGIVISCVFAWILGFGATMAEPALNALGLTVQNMTNGSFKKSMLMYAVAAGVSTGIMLGVTKLVFDYNLLYILGPGYVIAVILTALSSEEFVNIGWDSAGVTTGPVTVPLVLAMGLGFGGAVSAVEGFGILAAASIAPICAVLGLGVYVQYRVKKELAAAQA